MTSWTASARELRDNAAARQRLEEEGALLLTSGLPGTEDDVEFPRLTSTLLRSLPVGHLLETAREQVAEQLGPWHVPAVDEERWPGQSALIAKYNEVIEPERGALKAPRRGRDLGDDHYREVADVYKVAAAAGRAPTAAVADHFTIAKSSAAKKVARARERGFLPPTTRGRVGPVQEEI